jgi:hypothetical protein
MPHEHSTTTVSAKSSPRRSPPTLRRIERRSARDRLEARVRRFDASDAGFGVRPTESDRFAFDVEDFDVVRRVIHGESQPSVVGINRFDKRHLERNQSRLSRKPLSTLPAYRQRGVCHLDGHQ